MPAGLRVNCTADASARYSRWRDTALLISFAKNTPTYPTAMTITPNSTMGSRLPPPLRPLERDERPDDVYSEERKIQ